MRTSVWCYLCVFGLVACGEDANGGIDRNVEDRLTITQGVYGQTTSHDDVGSNPVEYHPMSISVFPAGREGSALAMVRSDDVGFYEIPLDPGAYALCTSFERCAEFQVESGECVRLDYEFSVGPGWSSAKVIRCPE